MMFVWLLLAGGVQRAGHVTMWSTMMLEFEGANAVLFCRADGNPSVTVTWFDPQNHHITSSSSHNQYLARLIQILIHWSDDVLLLSASLLPCLIDTATALRQDRQLPPSPCHSH